MTRKRLLLIASLPLAIVVTASVVVMLPPRPGVTKANFDRIQEGMTRTEVEQVFGKKADRIEPAMRAKGMPGIMVASWTPDDGTLARIAFITGGVAGKNWTDSDETFLAKIRRWVHLD